MKNMKQKFSIFVLLMWGFIMTQLYQNCAPLNLDSGSFTLASTEQGHNMGTGNGSHPPEEISKTVPSRSQHVVAKTFVGEVFSDVFTSSTYPVQNLNGLIQKWVTTKGPQFGGACNEYTSHSGKDCSGSVSNTNLPHFTDANTIREAYRVQMCENILGLDNGVKAALEKISLTVESPINSENIIKTYGLFYRDNPPQEIVVTTLLELNKVLSDAKATSTDKWRAILSQICESPGWQLF